jgi:phenylalanine-4-hydroxylase
MHYTEEDNQNWNILYSKAMQALPEIADEKVLIGIKKVGLPSDRVPDFEDINKQLSTISDWRIVPLEEMVEDNDFISMLAEKKYPCRKWLRSHEQIESDENEYDLFHDLFGHTTLLYIPEYCNYLKALGQLALKNINNKQALLFLKRVYWHTVQYGLVVSGNTLKIYGAHLLTSRSETLFAMSAGVPKYDFNISVIMDTPYVKNRYQDRYFVINNFEQLYNSMSDIEAELNRRIAL